MRSRAFRFSPVAAFAVFAVVTAFAASPVADPVERARAAASDLVSELMSRLSKALATGGPASAVTVCSEVAPAIARERSTGGLSIRRVTPRTRNPANAADAFEAERLARYERDQRAGKPLEETIEWTEEGESRTLRYLRPIVVGKTCLACHGDPAGIDPAVRRTLAQHYPADTATGYQEGDFRGAISVTVTPSP